jgi:hypothetical protein
MPDSFALHRNPRRIAWRHGAPAACAALRHWAHCRAHLFESSPCGRPPCFHSARVRTRDASPPPTFPCNSYYDITADSDVGRTVLEFKTPPDHFVLQYVLTAFGGHIGHANRAPKERPKNSQMVRTHWGFCWVDLSCLSVGLVGLVGRKAKRERPSGDNPKGRDARDLEFRRSKQCRSEGVGSGNRGAPGTLVHQQVNVTSVRH